MALFGRDVVMYAKTDMANLEKFRKINWQTITCNFALKHLIQE